jgi:hypothetical protein
MPNPSVLLSVTNITSNYTIPDIPEGANRILEILVCMYNGGGNAKLPSSVTVDGKTAIWVAGDDIATTQTRVAFGKYIILETDIEAVSEQVVSTSGQSGTVKNMAVRVIKDVKQGAPTSTNHQYVNTSSGTVGISYSLARANDSLTITDAYCSAGATTLMTNPSRTSTFSFTSGGGLNTGVATDNERTATVTVGINTGYISATSVNYEYAGAYSIDTINGESVNPAIDVSAINTATKTGLGTVTAMTMSNGSRSISGTPTMVGGNVSFGLPWPWADNSVVPPFGPVTITFTDTLGNSATKSSIASVPSGYAETVWSGATDLGDYYLGHFVALPNGNKIWYQTAPGITFSPNGLITANSIPATVNAMLYDSGTGLVSWITVDLGASGEVIVTKFVGKTLKGKILSGSILKGVLL